MNIIKAGLLISLLYNVIGVSFSLSDMLTPVIAAILISLSSVTVVIFSTLETRFIINKITMKDRVQTDGMNSAVYGLGFIGALIYYISSATGFWMGVIGFLKSMVWPAFLVYEALKALGA